MSGTDRRYGLIGNTAIKVPCRACSTSNITLSGEQTIDGVAIVTDDRVLVTAQTSSVDNGIYVADTGAWVRATDMDGTYDIVTGTLIKVNSGTANSGFWYVSTTGTPVIGTDAINFGMSSTVLAIVSAFMQTMLDDANAAAGRATLGAAGLTGDETIAGIKTFSGNNIQTGTLTMSGKSLVEAEGAAVASAASCNIWATDGNTCHITGTTQIDDFATAPQAGAWKKIIFDDVLILNQSANLNLNGGGSDITTAAGDFALVYADTTTQMDVFVIRKSGASTVAASTVGTLTAGTPLVLNPYSASATTTQAHGLGANPAMIDMTLECLTAEFNWSIGDKVKLGPIQFGVSSTGAWVVSTDATNVVLITSNEGIYILDKTARTIVTATPANWKLTITPYKLN